MKKRAVLFMVILLAMFFTCPDAYARALIFGEVKNKDGLPLKGITARILNSGYTAQSKQNGKFKLPYSPGNFTVVFEKPGYVPRAYTLSLTTKDQYPIGEVVLKKFPAFYDIYGSRIEAVDILVKTRAPGETLVVDQQKTDRQGHFTLKYYSAHMAVEARKENLRSQTVTLDLLNYEKPLPRKIIMPPSSPGLFHQKKPLPVSPFGFKKKQMVGLKIPAYYDGRYTAVGEPFFLTSTEKSFEFFWMPKTRATLGKNPFASKGGLFAFKVEQGGNFVRYDDGRSIGQKISFDLQPVFDATEQRSGGLVQKKIQVYKAHISLPAGQYVFFEGGGNSMDREPHPDKKLNCWYLMVGTEEEGREKKLSSQKKAVQAESIVRTITSGKIIEGAASGGSDVWPFRMKMVSYDAQSGNLKGQIEWLNLAAVHRIEGHMSRDRFQFRETAYIRKGNAALGCTYIFDLISPKGNTINGNWGGCGPSTGDVWFNIK